MGSPQPVRSWRSRWLLIAAAAIILLLLMLLVLNTVSGPGGIGSPQTVTLSGTASISGVGAKFPTGISFIIVGSQKTFNATVQSGGTKSGTYNISLPNGKTFSVEIAFGGPLGQLGSCNAGNLTLQQGPGGGSISRSFNC